VKRQWYRREIFVHWEETKNVVPSQITEPTLGYIQFHEMNKIAQSFICVSHYILCLVLFNVGALIPSEIIAQPFELHSSEFPPIGTVLEYDFVNNVSSVDTTSGQGITWDWSLLPTDSLQNHAETRINPNTAPYINQFPACNYSFLLTGFVTSHFYLELTNNTYESLGRNLGTTIDSYPIPILFLELPLTFGLQNTVPYDDGIATGVMNFECIGSGNLITPDGFFNDVLLVRKHYTYDIGSPLTQFEWYDCELGIRLLTVCFFNGNTTGVGVLTNSTVLGIDEQKENSFSIELINPACSVLHFSYQSNEELEASIHTPTGELVKNHSLVGSLVQREDKIEISDLAEGIYLLTVHNLSSGQHTTKRFVKLDYAK